jgi:hypothetical protein
MNNSDIIALAAIILSAIISVTTSLVAYFMNKMNIQAKRSEIAFEKRLEAFREIAEQTGKIKLQFSLIEDVDDFNSSRSNFQESLIDFYKAYRKNLVFLPPSISKDVAKYGNLISDLIDEDYTEENTAKNFNEAKEIENQIIDAMQKFIGYT